MNVNINTQPRQKAGSTNGQATATGKQSTSKLGKIVGGVADVAAKYGNLIPGVGGIVSTVGKLFSNNDPEWWQNVPGTGVSTNVPLIDTKYTAKFRTINNSDAEGTVVLNKHAHALRPSILEFTGTRAVDPKTTIDLPITLFPTDSMVSTYLMQEIRKVLNAIPLQETAAYREVLMNGSTAYALKKQLDKMIFMLEHSKPFIPAVSDGSFELLKPENHANLVALRDSLKEYIKASVKLPHTLCQYLSWRYGRIYRMGTSEKTGIVVYNVIDMSRSYAEYAEIVRRVIGFVTAPDAFYISQVSREARSKALADMYNAYIDHVIDVEVRDETQFTYDPKEMVLRTNLDLGPQSDDIGPTDTDLVYMDSLLDNKTTFMASTVSTAVSRNAAGIVDTGVGVLTYALFPVRRANFLGVFDDEWFKPLQNIVDASIVDSPEEMFKLLPGSYRQISQMGPYDYRELTYLFGTLAKACEYYNAEIYSSIYAAGGPESSVDGFARIDVTAPSTDLALVSEVVISNTHTYAFANLVYVGIKSYAAKEMPHAIKASEAMLEKVAETAKPGPDPLPAATAASVVQQSA